MIWEYLEMTLELNAEEALGHRLNNLGAEGWELVTTLPCSTGPLFIFKRPQPPAPATPEEEPQEQNPVRAQVADLLSSDRALFDEVFKGISGARTLTRDDAVLERLFSRFPQLARTLRQRHLNAVMAVQYANRLLQEEAARA